MTVKVNSQRCTGCPGFEEPPCVECCPGDLLFINKQGQSEIRNSAECWDCMACIKMCPNGALETQLPFMLAGPGASLQPKLSKDRIRWICKDTQGRIEEFEIPRVIESKERDA